MKKLLGAAAAVALAGAGLAAYRRRERLARWWDYNRAKTRLILLCRTDEEAAGATPSKADRSSILQADHAAELLERACRRFAERPLFVCRDGTRYTYGEVWRRVESLAGALHALGVRPQDRVGLCSFSSVDWIVADIACLYLNAVSVPLDHQSTQEQ
ncbi:MAG: AMP-binding protein, partial [Candidatus Eremiobacteraeota bacterium]|nr:AMP-binding protein [Candidatus Eremiobacteraeota bacterium]